jgi:hypothetical protein
MSLTASNQNVTLTWPARQFYYIIQTNYDFTQSNGWGNVGSGCALSCFVTGYPLPWLTNTLSGTNFFLNLPATNSQQFFRMQATPYFPIFCFGIFYNSLLEFSDSTTLQFDGLVHANGPIYVGAGSGATQTFLATVTTASTISAPANAGLSYSIESASFLANPPSATNVPAFILPLGTNNQHGMIEIPPAGEDPDSVAGEARLFNEAQVLLLVTNSPAGGAPQVTLILQASYSGQLPVADPDRVVVVLTNATPAFLKTNSFVTLPFLTLTNTFTDQRENQANMLVTQIDVGQYKDWLATNLLTVNKFFMNPAAILYVADQRNTGTTKLAVVRLLNAQQLPLNSFAGGWILGFSVTTPNPLYVWGNYNTTVDGIHFALTAGSTTNGYSVPAALFADAVTFLSSSWSDALSGGSYSSRNRVANNMTVNAAILAGNVPSTGATATNFSGGVQNLPRMLENWSAVTQTLNTSLVCLFSSQMATNQFQMPGVYYNPPTRNWAFDPNFYILEKLPPGGTFVTLPDAAPWPGLIDMPE